MPLHFLATNVQTELWFQIQLYIKSFLFIQHEKVDVVFDDTREAEDNVAAKSWTYDSPDCLAHAFTSSAKAGLLPMGLQASQVWIASHQGRKQLAGEQARDCE